MNSIAWWPVLIAVVIASITDLRTRRIPNMLVLPLLIGGVIVSTYAGGWGGLGESLLGIGLGAAVMGVLCFLGGMGMGDAKLCAAVGAWIGPQQLLLALVVMGLVGGVITLVMAWWGGFLGESLDGAGDLLAGFGKRGLKPHPRLVLSNPRAKSLPYAPAIAIGVIFSFFGGMK